MTLPAMKLRPAANTNVPLNEQQKLKLLFKIMELDTKAYLAARAARGELPTFEHLLKNPPMVT